MGMGHGKSFSSVHPSSNPCGAEKLVCKINLEFRLQQVEFSAMILYLWVTIS